MEASLLDVFYVSNAYKRSFSYLAFVRAFVAVFAGLASFVTLTEGAGVGLRSAAWAAANRAIGTRNGLQLT